MDLSGIIFLDKPQGLTSNQSLQRVKSILNFKKKIGHIGTLDPLATGMLPICLGEATKFSNFLLSCSKVYLANFKLGISTDTGDSNGNIKSIKEVPNYSFYEINQVLKKFIGKIEQKVPKYSAVKYKGKCLYYYARRNIETPEIKKNVYIYNIVFLKYKKNILQLEINCSKGTYIRSLAESIGKKLKCGAHVSYLRRKSISNFTFMQKIEEISKNSIFPTDLILMKYPLIEINLTQLNFLKNGQKLIGINLEFNSLFRIYYKKKFIGIAEYKENTLIAKRLINLNIINKNYI